MGDLDRIRELLQLLVKIDYQILNLMGSLGRAKRPPPNGEIDPLEQLEGKAKFDATVALQKEIRGWTAPIQDTLSLAEAASMGISASIKDLIKDPNDWEIQCRLTIRALSDDLSGLPSSLGAVFSVEYVGNTSIRLCQLGKLLEAAYEAKASVEGRLWFDELGHLNQTGSVPLSLYIGTLFDQLTLFLTRLESCERSKTGDYCLRDARAGDLVGMRVLWDNVVLLVNASTSKTLPPMTEEQRAAMNRDGVFATATAPTRNAKPLADALRQVLFSILYDSQGNWVTELPAATVAKLRTIAGELIQHRTQLEHSEGGAVSPTRESHELLARLDRTSIALPPIKLSKKTRQRKPSLVKQDRPLTKKEMQTLEVVGRHKHNFGAAARELGKDPTTVRENYERALAKSTRLLGGKSRSVNASALHVDRRGIQDTKDPRGG